MLILDPGAMREKAKKGTGETGKTLHKYELTATNTIHPPKSNDKKNLITWTSGDGNIQKLDYVIIRKT